MTQKLRFAGVRVAETSAKSDGKSEDRFPVGVAMAATAGVSIALWFLIAIALLF
jgi:hypothetical protein